MLDRAGATQHVSTLSIRIRGSQGGSEQPATLLSESIVWSTAPCDKPHVHDGLLKPNSGELSPRRPEPGPLCYPVRPCASPSQFRRRTNAVPSTWTRRWPRSTRRTHQRLPVCLEIGCDRDMIGLSCRFPPELRAIIEGQLLAQYPECRLRSLTEEEPLSTARSLWIAELSLHPDLFPIRRYGQFEDALTASPPIRSPPCSRHSSMPAAACFPPASRSP